MEHQKATRSPRTLCEGWRSRGLHAFHVGICVVSMLSSFPRPPSTSSLTIYKQEKGQRPPPWAPHKALVYEQDKWHISQSQVAQSQELTRTSEIRDLSTSTQAWPLLRPVLFPQPCPPAVPPESSSESGEGMEREAGQVGLAILAHGPWITFLLGLRNILWLGTHGPQPLDFGVPHSLFWGYITPPRFL